MPPIRASIIGGDIKSRSLTFQRCSRSWPKRGSALFAVVFCLSCSNPMFKLPEEKGNREPEKSESVARELRPTRQREQSAVLIKRPSLQTRSAQTATTGEGDPTSSIGISTPIHAPEVSQSASPPISPTQPASYDGPTSGKFVYNGTPVPNSGEIVFRGLPPGRIRVILDESSWSFRISPSTDGRQQLILRSKRSGEQRQAEVTWLLDH